MIKYTHKTKDGRRCRIVCTDRISKHGYAIVALLEPEINGQERVDVFSPEALTPISPYDDWPHEAKITVWMENSCDTPLRFRRRFAGVDKSGKPLAYAHGADKWGSGGETQVWDHAKLW